MNTKYKPMQGVSQDDYELVVGHIAEMMGIEQPQAEDCLRTWVYGNNVNVRDFKAVVERVKKRTGYET